MRRRYGSSRYALIAVVIAAVPLATLVKSCGYTARINVRPLYYNETQLVSFGRCSEPTNQNKVEILYALLTAERKVMGAGDPLLPTGANNGQRIEFGEALTIDGQAGKTLTATVTGNEFVRVSNPETGGKPRGFAFLIDNSRSLNGFNELDGSRINITDPSDGRISGIQNFITSERFTNRDRGTVIAFHGDGEGGVDAKQSGGQPPSVNWFTPSQSTLVSSLSPLRNEEDGKTPLYDGINIATQALRTLSSSVDPIIVMFNDGPDNSSDATFDEAKGALTADRNIPIFSVAAQSQLTVEGEDRLRELACATTPQGVVRLATGATIKDSFDPLQFATIGYWKAKVDLTLNGGALPAGRYTATGRLFADPSDAPKACEGTGLTACPAGMECDPSRVGPDAADGECFVRVSITYTVP